MASVQFIETEGGRLAVLSEADYLQLVEAAENAEAGAVIDSFHEKLVAGEEELIPSETTKRFLSGENPIRVWREFRRLSVAALAEAAGLSQPYISQIETASVSGRSKP